MFANNDKDPPGYKPAQVSVGGEEAATWEEAPVQVQAVDIAAATSRAQAHYTEEGTSNEKKPFATTVPVTEPRNRLLSVPSWIMPQPHPAYQHDLSHAPSPSKLQSPEKESTDTENEYQRTRHGRCIAASLRLLLLVVGAVVWAVFRIVDAGPHDESFQTSDGEIPPRMDELVNLFGSKHPDTANNLRDSTSSQYRAMQWLADDVETNGFNLKNDEARIVQRGTLAIVFYSILGDNERWRYCTGWLDHNTHECNWHGVVCSSGASGWATELTLTCDKVTDDGIYLEDDSLNGTLPHEVVFLDRLESLWMEEQVGGTIPTELGKLTLLKSLRLEYNNLIGTLPTELALLTQLECFDVESNKLSGTVPTDFGRLTDLEILYLKYNDITGQVPAEVCALFIEELWVDCDGSSPKIECDC